MTTPKVSALCALTMLATALLTVWWTASGRVHFGGDQPHYLIMSASVARDLDLDLRNNYEQDRETAEIYGPVRSHALETSEGWWPVHTPGLSILLAVPWALGGTLWAQLTLLGLSVVVLTMGSWRGFQELPPRVAMLTTAGIVASVPVLFGASQIYPDLPCGVLVLALVTWLWNTPRRSLLGWTSYGLVAGLLPWLHVKYLATTVVLAVLGGWHLWQERPRTRRVLLIALLFVLGPLSLAWWHFRTYGSVWGWRTVAQVASPVLRALEVFLGLHLDQAQGMFFQQPLFLLGLVGLGYMMYRRHPLTLPWLVLYGSLIVPNALHLTLYGGGGPAGRFGWSAMWLWLIPLGIWLKAEQATLERYVRPIVLTSLAYQAALAVRWVPTPSSLFPEFSEIVWARNSLFPVPLRYSLPSFYFWDFESYLWYPPNVVWVAAAVLLVVTGSTVAARTTHVLKNVWLSVIVVAALLLPARRQDEIAQSIDGVERSVFSVERSIRRRFEAEWMSPGAMIPATAVAETHASAGAARASQPVDPRGFVVFGPYIDLNPGRYHAAVALRLTAPSDAKDAGRFEVTASRGRVVLATMKLPVERLYSNGTYSTMTLDFVADEVLEDVEFRVRAAPEVDLLIDYVDLIPILP